MLLNMKVCCNRGVANLSLPIGMKMLCFTNTVLVEGAVIGWGQKKS